MAKKKGPGRPLRGVVITPKSTIPLSDELFLDVLKDLLSPNVYEGLLRLPKQTLDTILADLQSNLFTVAGETYADPNAIFLGEYGDKKGVQVTFNFEELYKDPVGYLRKLPKSYIKEILRKQDIESEIELQTIQELLSKGVSDHTSSFFKQNGNNVQMLESIVVNTPGGSQRAVVGAQGIAGIEAYEGYSKSIINWASGLQSLGAREKGKAVVRAKLATVFAHEFLLANGWKPKMMLGNDPLSQMYLRAYPNWNPKVPINEGKLFGLLVDNLPDSLFKRAFMGGTNSAKFNELYKKVIAESTTGRVLSVQNILSLTDPELALQQGARGNKALNTYEIAGKLGALNGPFERNADLKKFLIKELASSDAAAESWGFSSAGAVVALLDAYYGDPGLTPSAIGDSRKDPLFNRMFKGSYTELQDLRRFSDIMKDLDAIVVSLQNEISDNFMAMARYNGYEMVEKLVDSLPANITPAQKREIRKRMHGAVNWMKYVETRSDMEAQEEFFAAVGRGDIWKAYFYKGKFNSYVPKGLQNVADKILKRKLPIAGLSINDYTNKLIVARNKLLQKVGFSGSDNTTWMPLGLKKKIILRQQDFNSVFWNKTNNKPFVTTGARAVLGPSDSTQFRFNNLFSDNATWAKLGDKTAAFRENFFNFKTGSITIEAAKFSMLPDFLESVHILITQTPGGVTEAVLDNYFKMLAVDRNLIDTYPAFAVLRASPNFAKYKKAIFNFFDEAQAHGVAQEEYLSFAMLLKNKGLVIETSVGKFSLVRYTPLLNSIAQKLSNVQTYLFEFVGEKVLKKFLFTSPLLGNVYKKMWGMYNPRYGGLGQATWLISKMQTTVIGKAWGAIARSAIMRGAWAMFSRLLPAFLTTSTAGTAYLAIIINRFWMALAKSLWYALRGRFNLIGKEFYSVLDDLVVKPVKFLFNLGVKILVYTLFVIGGFLAITAYVLLQAFMPKIPDGSGGALNETSYYELNGQVCADFVAGNSVEEDFRKNISGGIYSAYSSESCPGWRTIEGKKNLHTGIDFSTPSGTPLYNPSNNNMTVEYAGYDNSGYGNLVVLKQEVNGVSHYLYFAHLNSIDVSVGDTLRGGQVFAKTGNTGWSSGPHLHFELRIGSRSTSSVEDPCTILSCPTQCLQGKDLFSGTYCN